jgi:hypothetical protein
MGRLAAGITFFVIALLPVVVSAHGADVYRMDVQVGPYPVVVEFSEWPLRAERSVERPGRWCATHASVMSGASI